MSIKIGNIDVSYFKVGGADCSIYLGDTLLYPTTPPTPTGSTCYEVINDPITAYTATTYDSVYSFADSKWYMKNNLNQYEEYGIYDTATTLSDLTYYEGKLAAVGTTEYQYSGGTWVSAGTYVTTEVTYDIPSGYSTTYQGQTIPTTFKISVADMDVLGTRYINIYDNTNTSYYLDIRKTRYRYYGATRITGTVTSDSDYYYFTLTDDKPSIEIYRTRGFNGTVHIITGQKNISVEYEEKDVPLTKVYSSVAAMEAEVCPTIGVGQYGVVGSDVYQFDSTELWLTAGNHYKVMERSANAANVVGCNSSSELTTGDTKPSYFDYSGITEAVIGNCCSAIGEYAFSDYTSLTSIDIPSGVTSIGQSAFNNCSSLASITVDSNNTTYDSRNNCNALIDTSTNTLMVGCKTTVIPNTVTAIDGTGFYNCTGLTSITIPDSVTSIGNGAFQDCSNLTSINIPSGVTTLNRTFYGCNSLPSITIPSGVTSIGAYSFYDCTGLTNVTVNAVTPPTLGDNVFDNTNDCPIYVPSGSVNAYKSATNWRTYASRIQAIPNS